MLLLLKVLIFTSFLTPKKKKKRRKTTPQLPWGVCPENMALVYSQSSVCAPNRVSLISKQTGLSSISAKANASMIDTDCLWPGLQGSGVSWPTSDGPCYVLMFPLWDLSVVNAMATPQNEVTASSSPTKTTAACSSAATVTTSVSSSVCMASEVWSFMSFLTENARWVTSKLGIY